MKALAKILFWALVPPSREPDFVIGDSYMLRWWLIPRNKFFNIYLHHVRHSDDDRALHDHPWWSFSLCLAGGMKEIRRGIFARRIEQGRAVLRSARTAHRLELAEGETCWTLFITGPVIRDWGFHCPQGWRHWREFVDGRDNGQVGRGCE